MKALKGMAYLGLLIGMTCAANGQRAQIAYTEHGALYLATDSGHVVKTIRAKLPIGEFAISPSSDLVVFRPTGGDYGGPLYLLEVKSGRLDRLTKNCSKSEGCAGHVYADPDFSPGAGKVVFAVHDAAHGDLVEASGPLAVIDLASHRIHTLKSTTNIDGQGPAFANNPQWSPDGKQILLSFETGAAITDAEGEKLWNISDQLGTEGWSNAVGWLGPGCVVYIAGKDVQDARRSPARVLQLGKRTSSDMSGLIGVSKEAVTNLVAVSPQVRVRRDGDQLVVESGRSRWTIPYSGGNTFVKIIPERGVVGQVPVGCARPAMRAAAKQ